MADFEIERPSVDVQPIQPTYNINTPSFTIEINGGTRGEKGDKGDNGADGRDGRDGIDGVNGVGVASIVQTTTSTVSGGTNVITATLTNGEQSTFDIMNGLAGKGGITPLEDPIVIQDLEDGLYMIPANTAVHGVQEVGDVQFTTKGTAIISITHDLVPDAVDPDTKYDVASYYVIQDASVYISESEYSITPTMDTTFLSGAVCDDSGDEWTVSEFSLRNLGNVLTKNDVIDNLTSTITNKPLSAKQGKILKGMLDDVLWWSSYQTINDPDYHGDVRDGEYRVVKEPFLYDDDTIDYYINSETIMHKDSNNDWGRLDDVLDAKANTSDIPTNTSDLNNDSGFITSETDPVFSASAAAGIDSSDISAWNGKQDALVSGTNIKTINNNSILGSGDLTITGSSTDVQINDTSITAGGVANIKTNSAYNASTNKIATMSDLPTVPTKVSELTNDSGFISSESDPVFSASDAYGITSTDISNWNAKSDFSGSYTDLTDKPTIPSDTGDLTNGAGFITSSDIAAKEEAILIEMPSGTIPDEGDSANWFPRLTFGAAAQTTLNTLYTEFGDASGYSNGSDIIDKDVYLVSPSGTSQDFVVARLENVAFNAYSDLDEARFDAIFYFKGITEAYTKTTYKAIGEDLSIPGDATWKLSQVLENPSTEDLIDALQEKLVSGTNIKTINSQSLLGNGDITIGGGGTQTDVQINGDSIVASDVANILTETAYDSSTNKLATVADLPDTSDFIDKDVNNLTNYSLTTTLQANKSITKGIEYIVGTQASATNLWTGTSTDTGCSSGTLYTGKVIIYHLPVAGSSSAATLNLTLPDGTTTGAKNVYRLATTTTTTNFAAGCDILMVYDGTNWKVNAYVDTSGSNTIGYQLRTNSAIFANKTGYAMNRYTLLFEVAGGLSGAATTIATGTTKTTVPFKYIPGGVIKYYSTSGSIANNSDFTATGLWDQYTLNLGYTFNTGSTLTSGKPVYMRCTVNADGTLSPDYSGTPSHPIVQDLPTTADNKVYVFLGQAYSTTNIELMYMHPIYEYKNGKIREYISETGGGTITDVQVNSTSVVAGGVANLLTETAYNSSTNKIATMSDLPTVPTTVSSFTNDSGYITGISSGDVTTALGFTPYDASNPSGYISSYTETDPIFTASAAAGISSSDISNWNNKSITDLSSTVILNDLSSGIYRLAKGTVLKYKESENDNNPTTLTTVNKSALMMFNIKVDSGYPLFSYIILQDDHDGTYSSMDNTFDLDAGSNSHIMSGCMSPYTGDIWNEKDFYINEVLDWNSVVDNLTSSYTHLPLSAKQGKALKDAIDAITIPTVNNSTITIQKNGTNVDSFTTNASSNKSINITVPTNTSDLNNDSGFVTTNNDIQVNGSSIVVSNVANLITESAYDSSTNKIATMNDVPTITLSSTTWVDNLF